LRGHLHGSVIKSHPHLPRFAVTGITALLVEIVLRDCGGSSNRESRQIIGTARRIQGAEVEAAGSAAKVDCRKQGVITSEHEENYFDSRLMSDKDSQQASWASRASRSMKIASAHKSLISPVQPRHFHGSYDLACPDAAPRQTEREATDTALGTKDRQNIRGAWAGRVGCPKSRRGEPLPNRRYKS
jgi:hypothetical protein